jgi:hypothetical protein
MHFKTYPTTSKTILKIGKKTNSIKDNSLSKMPFPTTFIQIIQGILQERKKP